MACVIFTVDETAERAAAGRRTTRSLEFAAKNADIAIAVRQHQPAPRRRGGPRGEAAGRHRAGARTEAAPADPAVLPQRPAGLSALRGVRRGAAAGALPHRPQRHRHRHARRRRHPAEVRRTRCRSTTWPWTFPTCRSSWRTRRSRGRTRRSRCACTSRRSTSTSRAGRRSTSRRRSIQYANTLLKHKVLFGSDYPLLTPDRWMADFEKIAIRDEVRPLILKENAARLLGLVPVRPAP